MARKGNKTWAVTFMTVIRESCCSIVLLYLQLVAEIQEPWVYTVFSLWNYSVFILFGLNPNFIEVSGKNPKSFAELGIRHFVCFTTRVLLQMENVIESQKTVYSAEENRKIEDVRMLIREKDCTFHNLLQVKSHLSSFLDVQAALIATIQQYNFSTHKISSESGNYKVRIFFSHLLQC